MSGEVMTKIFGTPVGIEGKSNQDLEGRQYVRARAVNELAVGTRQGWTGEPMLVFCEMGSQQLCSSLLVGVSL